MLLFSSVKLALGLNDTFIKGLERLNIITLRDLLFYQPISYQVKILSPNLSKLQEGQLIQTEVIIREVSFHQRLKVLVSNNTGTILLVFFNKLPSFILSKLRIGSTHIISGKVQLFNNNFQISHPEFVINNRLTTPIEPIYPLTFGIVNKQLYSCILKGIDLLEKNCIVHSPTVSLNMVEQITNYIKSLLEDLKILHLYRVNIEADQITREWSNCIRRFSYKELFANQMALYNFRRKIQLTRGNCFLKATTIQKTILKQLGFKLTPGQKQVIEEIEEDQKSSVEMIRLLQGDVGSGKTLVALLTMVNVVYNKSQATLMVPTDLLANQHYEFFTMALNGTGIKLALLTGKIYGKAREKILLELENGCIDILIGTHSLFQEKVNFKKLGYIVIDEQHRFGVQQRLNLINKASHPDVLIMTATPIPRSLTLTMFGDMNISRLMSKPKNRLPIITTISPITKLSKVIYGLEQKLKNGEKIYWICPLIEQEDKESTHQEKNILLADIENRFHDINVVYPNIVGMIHGKMRKDQKDIVMQQFKEGIIKILVATTVIEVGIDVEDATLIIIENAEQFGLAQLHQIRGRVGRGSVQSHCVLLYNPFRLTNIARSRFKIIKVSNDGFFIAEQDLILRGSGELLGTKQSGEIRFFFADLTRDNDLLNQAHKLVEDHSINNSENNELIDFQIKLFTRTELNELK